MPLIISMISDFLNKILVVSYKNNCSVSSWIRTDKRNRLVGGSPTSQHLIGLAVDLVPDDWNDEKQIVDDCIRLGLVPVVERSKNHIHVQALHKA